MARNEVKVTITGDADKFKRSLAESETGLAAFSAKMDAFGSSMRSAGSRLTAGLTLPIVGAGLVAINFAGQLQDAEAMNSQVFGTMSKDIEKWADTSAEAFGLSKKDAIEWSNQFGIRLVNISGMTKQHAGETSMALTGLAGDLASAFGGPVTDAAAALSSALTGEFEPMKRYGIVINETALKNEYMAQTGKKLTEQLTPQQKQLLTLSLLMKGAATVTGDYSRNADGATNTTKTMRAKFEDLAATLGTKLLPFATKIADWLTQIADKFENLSPKTQNFILIGLALAAALGPVVWFVGVLATAIGGLATALGFLFSPIGLVVAAIVAIGAGLFWLYKNNEGFHDWVNRVASAIKDKLGQAVQWFKDDVWPKLKEAFNDFRENVLPKLKEAWNDFVDNVWPKVVDAFTRFKDEIWPKLVDAFNKFKDDVLPVLVEKFKWFQSEVLPVLMTVAGVAAQMLGMVGENLYRMLNSFITVWGTVISVVTGAFGIVWAVVQANMGTIQAVISSALGVIQGLFTMVSGVLSGNWSKTWDGMKQVVSSAFSGMSAAFGLIFGPFKSGLEMGLNSIKTTFNTVTDGLGSGFKTAFGAIKSAWNNTLGGKSLTMPDLPGLPGRGQTYTFPTLHTGGIVPGPIGQEVFAKLQAGEMVLSIAQVKALGAQPAATMSAGATGSIITVNVTAGVGDPAQIGKQVVAAIRSYEKVSGPSWRAA